MTKKSNVSEKEAALKTADPLMKDVSDPIEAALEPSAPKKVRFPRLKKFNEKRELNTTKFTLSSGPKDLQF